MASLKPIARGVIDVAGKLISRDPVIGTVRSLAVADGELWVADGVGDPFLHIIDLGSDSVIRSFGRKGEGPGDFARAENMSVRSGSDGGIWVFDPALQRLTHVALSAGLVDSVVQVLQLPVGDAPFLVKWLTDSTMISIGLTVDRRLLVRDGRGRIVGVHPAQLAEVAGVPDALLEANSTGVDVCVRPDRGRFAMTFATSGRIDLFDASTFARDSVAVPFPGSDAFTRDRHGGWQINPQRMYYAGCAATNSSLFALFSGRSKRDFGESAMFDAPYVQVFDWSGRLRATYHLDHAAFRIAVDTSGTIYGASLESGDIYSYRIRQGHR